MLRRENAIPAIVDRETWEKVQRKMMENKRYSSGRPPSARDYPLKVKVFCGECKSAMTVTRSNGKYYYYACSGKDHKCCCSNMPMRVGDLERKVAGAVRDMVGKPSNMEALISILREQKTELQISAASRLKTMINRRDSICRQLDAATTAVLSGLHSPTLTAKVNKLEVEKAAIDHEMQQLRTQVAGSCATEEQLHEVMTRASGSDAAVLSIVARVDVHRDKIVIWTMLDTDPSGKFNFDAELIITLGDWSQ